MVAFEIDDVDAHGYGWSVALTGIALEITDTDMIDELRTLPFNRWVRTDRDRYVGISLDTMSGRRMTRTVPESGPEPLPRDARMTVPWDQPDLAPFVVGTTDRDPGAGFRVDAMALSSGCAGIVTFLGYRTVGVRHDRVSGGIESPLARSVWPIGGAVVERAAAIRRTTPVRPSSRC